MTISSSLALQDIPFGDLYATLKQLQDEGNSIYSISILCPKQQDGFQMVELLFQTNRIKLLFRVLNTI
jgi:hypothetical protein